MSNQDRDRAVADMAPPYWNISHFDWAIKLRDLAATLPGVKITGSGTSADTADFSFVADDGKHYWVFVRSLEKPS